MDGTMKDHTPVVIPPGFKVTRLPSHRAYQSEIGRHKGGAIVGSSSPKWSAMSSERGGLRGYAAQCATKAR